MNKMLRVLLLGSSGLASRASNSVSEISKRLLRLSGALAVPVAVSAGCAEQGSPATP